MPAPDPNCGIIAGSAAELFKASEPVPIAPATGDIEWVKVGDLNSFTFTRSSTDTSLNADAWIRSLPMERGMTITASGNLNTLDEGQKMVEEEALDTGCAALGFFRFYVPGAHAEDPPYRNVGFWAWIDMGDVTAGSTDAFSWAVTLQVWSPPVELDDQNQPVLEDSGTRSSRTAQPHRRGAQTASSAGSSGVQATVAA
jgi:hypothetical protein